MDKTDQFVKRVRATESYL